MAEGGRLLPVSLGFWWPDRAGMLPIWSADGHVIAFCQSGVVLLGCLAAVVVLRRLLANNRTAWLAASSLALVLAGAGRWLVAAA